MHCLVIKWVNRHVVTHAHIRKRLLPNVRQVAAYLYAIMRHGEKYVRKPLYKIIFFHWHYSPLWALACRTISFHFFPICHQLSPSSHSQNLKISFYFLFPSFPGSSPSSRPFQFLSEDFLGILSSSVLPRWPNELNLCRFIHFTIFSPLLISSSSRFVRLFHSPFSYLGLYILLNNLCYLHVSIPSVGLIVSMQYMQLL